LLRQLTLLLVEVLQPMSDATLWLGSLYLQCAPSEGASCLLALIAPQAADLTLSILLVCVVNIAVLGLSVLLSFRCENFWQPRLAIADFFHFSERNLRALSAAIATKLCQMIGTWCSSKIWQVVISYCDCLS